MSLLLSLALAASLTPASSLDPMRASQWIELDLFHVARTLPDATDLLGSPIHPGFQLAYHRNVLGAGTLGGGFSFQGGYFNYDEVLFALSLGTGLEGTVRTTWGLYAALGLRVEYARAFVGSNNFVLEDGSYRQETDDGRGFLRITPIDFTVGYGSETLRRLGLAVGLRYAWLVDSPLYEGEGDPWSYTAFGLAVLWTWEGRP